MIILDILVDSPDELLAVAGYGPGAIVRVESGPASGGPFAEFTTIPLVTLTTAYVAYDPAGTTSTWYRIRNSSADGSALSLYSDPWLGGQIVSLASIDDLRAAVGQTNPVDSSDDEPLFQILDWVSGLIHLRTGRYFLPDPPIGDGVFLFDFLPYAGLPDPNVLFDRCLRVRRGIRYITKLEIAGWTNGPFYTIDPLDYFLLPQVQNRDAGWPADELWLTDFPQIVNTPSQYINFNPGYGTTRLTGGLGFATPPAEIEAIAIAASVRQWAGRQAGQQDFVGPTEMGRPIVSRVFSIDEKITLDSYRQRGIR